jgi:predicted NUDIX family NTP pyrophosphohydrolase
MKRSAGILMYRKPSASSVEVFLVHPGGPFFAKKDEGAWTIPKGEIETGKDALEEAIREFEEETSFKPSGRFEALGEIKQKGGKLVQAWAVEGDVDAGKIVSNGFEIEWPPASGKKKIFPEVDRAGWFKITEAKRKINPAQAAFLDKLIELKGAG